VTAISDAGAAAIVGISLVAWAVSGAWIRKAATPEELLVRFAYSLALPVAGVAAAGLGLRGLDVWLSFLLLGCGTLLALLAVRRLRK